MNHIISFIFRQFSVVEAAGLTPPLAGKFPFSFTPQLLSAKPWRDERIQKKNITMRYNDDGVHQGKYKLVRYELLLDALAWHPRGRQRRLVLESALPTI